ncbi:ABC transporter permease [Sphaerisporangium rubeum]|uniref:Peptide/nickel transport system permease protein n=1 Tax=Sphaerisporangium rubeum TaxID=321317 RepID=A0A7X0IG04_9ACTN|nr:ABC transporter permease [Sphaerisporangium rubeum]MBB6474554.1 peptide/nickel transport system permease protein [Sphaerisporangium rubeum]
MTLPSPATPEADSALTGAAPPPGTGTAPAVGRSPSQLMWRRFRRDRTGVASAVVVAFFFLVAILAPVISWLYGKDPYTTYGQNTPGLLNDYGYPILPNGGVSGDFWFGLEPGLGRDVFMQLVYGIRTSLSIAVIVTIVTTLIGVVMGIWSGYAGGKTDYVIGRIIDTLLAFPSQLFLIVFLPVIEAAFVSPEEETPVWLRYVSICLVLTVLGWATISRLLRSQVLSLREREFIEAARVTGASPRRVIFKELLPNLWTPIIIQSTLALPLYVGAEAGLGFLGVGMTEPTPDWGRMFLVGSNVYHQDITYLVFPGVSMVIFVVAFNLLGDSLRDAFDPKTRR